MSDLSIVEHATQLLPVDVLRPHPLNRPATGVKREQIDTLKTLIGQNGYNASKPITVREIEDGFQIIEGHHRWLAATELGYSQLPCVVEALDDIETNLRLLIGNQQEGNDPLDIGLNALETVEKSKGGRGVKSEMSVSGFAERLGKSQQYVSQVTQAAKVYQKLTTQVVGFNGDGRTKHLFEIHAAPPSTWPLLAGLLQELDWSVKDTKAAVERVKLALSSKPDWLPMLDDGRMRRVALEPGFAKAVTSTHETLAGLLARLPERATGYRLVPTEEFKDIDGREHQRHKPEPFDIFPRALFHGALEQIEGDLTAAKAESIYKEITRDLERRSQAEEHWRPVLTEEEHAAQQVRLREIAAMEERERFRPRLLQGDVLERLRLLPSEHFDLICIDPPYNMDKADWDSFGNGQAFAAWAKPWLTECRRVLKDSGALYVFGINRMLSHLQGELDALGLRYRNWIVWDTIQGAGGGLWVNRHESILYYSKTDDTYEDADSIKLERHEENVREYKGKEYAFKNPSNVWRFPCVDDKHAERTHHPTQKPVELIERIILASSPQEGRVLDCFMGSGTTGVACMRQRRFSTGIEREADYIAIAESRFDVTEIGGAS